MLKNPFSRAFLYKTKKEEKKKQLRAHGGGGRRIARVCVGLCVACECAASKHQSVGVDARP